MTASNEDIALDQDQLSLINLPIEGSIFLSGPSGSGKSTATVYRLEKILSQVPGYQILIITPQQSLARPYRAYLSKNSKHIGSVPTISTINGLAREFIRKFWPLVSSEMGFQSPNKPPMFLSLETSQYSLSKIVDPLLDQGYFQTVTIDRNRLLSQIIDNLNKAALSDIPIDEISTRLKSTTGGAATLHTAFDQAQECAKLFREYCLRNNLVDFSLNVSLFRDHIWPMDFCRNYLQARYSVLIADNLEEDTPFAHSIFSDLIKIFRSSLFIYDEGGGFRSFLGADPEGALKLSNECQHSKQFTRNHIPSEDIEIFQTGLSACISKEKNTSVSYHIPNQSELALYRFYPEMISATCTRIKQLIDEGIPPNEIVVLSPYLSDSLKFSMTETLRSISVPTQTFRPSRMYIDTSQVRSLITFAKLSHPDWAMNVSFFEFRNLIMQITPGMDIVRSDLIAKNLFSKIGNDCPIKSFDMLNDVRLQERITFHFGEKLEILRRWLLSYLEREPDPLDIFFQNLYGEVLSQPGFNFHLDFESANLISRLIISIRSFRNFIKQLSNMDPISVGKEYITTIENGLIPSSFNSASTIENAVLIAPAHTFLMENRSAAYQFWLDIGSLGWWERLYQPLTNPYVFRPNWDITEMWTDQEEYTKNQQVMQKLINGLFSRCAQGVIAVGVQVNEYGSENQGPLLQAFQQFLRRGQQEKKGIHV